MLQTIKIWKAILLFHIAINSERSTIIKSTANSFQFHQLSTNYKKTTTKSPSFPLRLHGSLSSSLQKNADGKKIQPEEKSNSLFSCTHCGKTFETRNALFRHLRNDPICSKLSVGGDAQNSGVNRLVDQKDTVAILFGYDSFSSSSVKGDETYDSFVTHPSDAELVSKKIIDAFDFALEQEYGKGSTRVKNESSSKEQEQGKKQQGVVSSTQVSVAKLRSHKSLSQENGICAAGDVMTLSYKYQVTPTLLDESKSFQDEKRHELLQRLKQSAIQYLEGGERDTQIIQNSFTDSTHGSSTVSKIRILSVRLLPRDTLFHAERSCTQRVYHYLLPIKWIKGGEEIERWWLENQIINENAQHEHDDETPSKSNNAKFGIKGHQRLSTPSPKELPEFKKILKSFESEESVTLTEDNGIGYDVVSKKRFGLLAKKSFRAWHNFADPTIRGAAVSPNNKSVWRALDRCRIVQLGTYRNTIQGCNSKSTDDKDHVMIIIELRGDDFIQQQARRIIGSAVAIANGWLPSNFADIATSPDVFIETPIAPGNHMYQIRPRFHYDELINGGKSIFREDFDENLEVVATEELHSRMIYDCTNNELFECHEWLSSLKNEVTPRIRGRINSETTLSNDDVKLQMLSLLSTPPKYEKTLHILQDIISFGKWPATSMARSRVIKEKTSQSNVEVESELKQNGSFTIINPNYMNGILLHKNQTEVKVPLGNQLFPDLVDAVFQLEEALAEELHEKDKKNDLIPNSKRLPSSHCAVNCNAQFTPHVDSGRGCGQSLSMIVGLGRYLGGNICVEDESFDICYKPKQFDGWRDRHWTEPFQGQRFSLVWFTPEMKGVNDS